MVALAALIGGFRAEFVQLLRSRLFVALTVIQAVTFLFLVSLFGMTGSFAPTAIIVEDKGPYAKEFIAQLEAAHHSFDLRVMDQASAQAVLNRGDLVAIITIPKDFSDAVAHGKETTVKVQVDNVNTDMTEDIKRALPSAIVAFGNRLHLPDIRVHATEIDLINHDTGFIPYLVVSGLALDAFVIACMLSAMAVAREFEAGTVKLLAIAPVHPLISILGRVLATDAISTLAMILPVVIAIFGYQIMPLHPLEMVGVILLSIVIFSCIGVALGAVLKRTLAVASLVFGLAFPLYLCSGSLEPQRFDGNLIWALAHISPVYYSVGILEQAFHDLQVTPEPTWLNFVVLLGWAVAMLLLAAILLRKAVVEKTATQPMVEEQEQLQRRGIPGTRWLWQRRQLVHLHGNWPLPLFLLLLTGCGLWLNVQQNQQRVALSRQQSAALQAIAGQQDKLLSNYTNSITDLLLHDNLLQAKAGDMVKTLADVRTQEALRQLDSEHKAALLSFLYNARLIDDERHIISLKGADLHDGQFDSLDLRDSNMAGANFSGADLHGVNLRFATLTGVNFSNADLSGANLSGADLSNVDISTANLAGANLAGVTGISIDQLGRVRSLAGATLPDGSVQPGDDEDSE
jgi:ABC-2 type transport system permease protein